MIRWSEAECTEFFGASATYYEDADSYAFTCEKNGLRLLLTVFASDGGVYVGIWREGWKEPVIDIHREGCSHVQSGIDARGRKYLEAGRTKELISDMGIAPLLDRAVRVFLDPQLAIELRDPNEKTA